MDKVQIMDELEIAEFSSKQRSYQETLIKQGKFEQAIQAMGYRRSVLAENLKALNPEIIGIEARDSASRLWAAILPETGGKIVRIQYWGRNGFNAHACYETPEQALRELVMQGYIYPDKGSLRRMAATKSFIEGNRLAEETIQYLSRGAA